MITRHTEMFDVEAHEDDHAQEHPLFGVKPQPPVLSNRPLLFAVEPSDAVEIDLIA
jgi:hypothetical protein